MKQKSLQTSIFWKVSFPNNRSAITVITIPPATQREIQCVFPTACNIKSVTGVKNRCSFMHYKGECSLIPYLTDKQRIKMPVIFLGSAGELMEYEKSSIMQWKSDMLDADPLRI